MHFNSSSLRIVKIAADSYHFILQGRFRQIDEIIDAPKLIAMLRKESLDLKGNNIKKGRTCARLRSQGGHKAFSGMVRPPHS